ncbi:TetR/AcrR family transcriptional regulator [Thermoleophilia bacterium SCSIO 60948]|nr:TetR/AcrR family transcriptional regulator [Thermoleophilia bacterium SCSIO 60948]
MTGGTVAREDQARETRERLVSAARDLLETLSYEEITVDEVSRRAEVGRTTFYLHFESKAELYREIAGHETEGLIELVGGLGVIDPSDGPAMEDFIFECEERFARCQRFLEITALAVHPHEQSQWLDASHRTIVARSLAGIRDAGQEPAADAEAELAIAATLLMQFMLVYASLGNDPPEGWRDGLSAHLRLALERARAGSD